MTTSTELPVVPLSEASTWQNLHEHFAAARAQSGFALGDDGSTMAIGLLEVETVLKDPRFGSANLPEMFGITGGPLAEWWPQLMFGKQPPEHTRLRQLVSRAFTPMRVEKMRPKIAASATELLEPAIESGTLDVMPDFANRLPVRSIADTLGLPEDAAYQIGPWAAELDRIFSFGAGDNTAMLADVEAALVKLNEFIRTEIEDRRANPGDDLLSALIEVRDGSDRLSEEELVALVGNLIWAGSGTTVRQLSIAAAMVAMYPDQTALVRADESLVESAVEEILRFEPTVVATGRVPTADIEVDGVMLPAGVPVVANLLSAARDERVFADPHRYDVRRSDSRPIAFGAGIHFCLGAALARAALQEGVRALVRGATEIDLVEPPVWSEFLNLRDPGKVKLTLKAA